MTPKRTKNRHWTLYVPDVLDLSGLSERVHDYARYLVHAIHMRPILDRRLKYREYVNLKKKHLFQVIPESSFDSVRK